MPGLHVLIELSLYGVGSLKSVTPGHNEHAASMELPTPGEYLPLRHGWQSNAPGASEYLPAAHATHAALGKLRMRGRRTLPSGFQPIQFGFLLPQKLVDPLRTQLRVHEGSPGGCGRRCL